MSEIEPIDKDQYQIQPAQDSQPTDKGSIADEINKLDPKKISDIMKAITSPFFESSEGIRKDILFLMGGLLFLIIAIFLVLILVEDVDPQYMIFFLCTAFGYIMGFLGKFFIRD